MESGVIPPNLHITKPLEVECIRSGKLKIPVENEHFKGITGWIGNAVFFLIKHNMNKCGFQLKE